eukprot:9470400-Pyramimonas_sp.AAC.1
MRGARLRRGSIAPPPGGYDSFSTKGWLVASRPPPPRPTLRGKRRRAPRRPAPPAPPAAPTPTWRPPSPPAARRGTPPFRDSARDSARGNAGPAGPPARS